MQPIEKCHSVSTSDTSTTKKNDFCQQDNKVSCTTLSNLPPHQACSEVSAVTGAESRFSISTVQAQLTSVSVTSSMTLSIPSLSLHLHASYPYQTLWVYFWLYPMTHLSNDPVLHEMYVSMYFCFTYLYSYPWKLNSDSAGTSGHSDSTVVIVSIPILVIS